MSQDYYILATILFLDSFNGSVQPSNSWATFLWFIIIIKACLLPLSRSWRVYLGTIHKNREASDFILEITQNNLYCFMTGLSCATGLRGSMASHLCTSSARPDISKLPQRRVIAGLGKSTFHYLFWEIWSHQVGWRTVICSISSWDAPN